MSGTAPYAAENRYNPEIGVAANAYGVPVALIKAIIGAESSFVNGAASSSSYGLMQLYPPTARTFDPNVTVDQLRNDAGINIDIGTRYLRRLLNLFGDDLEAVASAYNAGEGNAKRATAPYRFCAEWKVTPKPAGATLDRDCKTIVNVQVGEFPNQRYYVDRVMFNYRYYQAQEAAATPVYTGPAYGPDDPRGWRPGEMASESGNTTILVLAGVALVAALLLGRR